MDLSSAVPVDIFFSSSSEPVAAEEFRPFVEGGEVEVEKDTDRCFLALRGGEERSDKRKMCCWD